MSGDRDDQAAGGWREWLGARFAPTDPVSRPDVPQIPTIWLLGKTGAGKSSLIQAMTGSSAAEIGNGFVPCTKTARRYDFPADAPLLRFLDTRGLGEVAYDPAADLAELQRGSHALLVMMRIDDPVQGMVLQALRALRRQSHALPLIVLHTAPDQAEDPPSAERMIRRHQMAVEEIWGRALPHVTLDLRAPSQADLTPLHLELAGLLPEVVQALRRIDAQAGEAAEFARHRSLILGYVGGASAGGALPVVGGLSVTGLQVTMLSALAARYGFEWGRKEALKFAASLGAGVLGGQALGLGARELAKLVPVIGQTLGPVVGAAWSGTATWALGRVACYYFYHQNQESPVDEAALRALYAEALKRGPHAAD